MSHKTVSLVVAGSNEVRDLSIPPGTKVGDALKAAGLEGYLVSRGPNEPFLRQEDDLFEAVPSESKLFASTVPVAGAEGSAPASF